MPIQSSFERLTRVPVLAAILLLFSTGIAGVPIRVSWHPNPVLGNLPTAIKLELDRPADVEQPVAVMYDNPGPLNAAPATGTFAVGQSVLILAVNTNPTTTEKHVFATTGTGGGSMRSDQLVISPTVIIDGYVGGPEKSAAAMAAAPPDPGAKMHQPPGKGWGEGVPIAVSFVSNHDLYPGGTTNLFIGLADTVTDMNGQSMTITFDAGFNLLTKPTQNPYSVIVPFNANGVGVEIKAGTNEGTVTITVDSGGGKQLKTHIYIVKQP